MTGPIRSAFTGRSFVRVRRDACVGCGRCVTLCPLKVLALDKEGKATPIGKTRCAGCARCLQGCPNASIEMQHIEY